MPVMSSRLFKVAAEGLIAGLALLVMISTISAQDAKIAEALKVARKYEAERVRLVEKISRTVIAVFPAPKEEREVGDRSRRGAGSGVIIDKDGHALTNYHVVRGAKRVAVGLSDGRVVGARVKGIDPTGDIAVIQLEEGPHPYAELGDSDKLRIGDRALAMGNPFSLATDFKPTVSMGIVSGLHRYLPGDDEGNLIYADCIQVDAPLNPGNSGGPLFDATGRLIGINGRVMGRRIAGRRLAGSAVGFAIPINQIAEFLPDLVAGKEVHHAILGVAFRTEGPGVIIRRVLTDGPADHAGLKPGDVLKRFRGRDIHSKTDLINRIGILPAGKTVKIALERDSKTMELEVVLGGRPANGSEVAFEPKKDEPAPAEDDHQQPPGDVLTADEVARRYVEAIGGYEKLDAVKDIVTEARLDLDYVREGRAVRIQGTASAYHIPRKNMILQETVFRLGAREMRQITAFNGKEGWVHSSGETRNMEDGQAARLKEELVAFERLNSRDGWKGLHARCKGRETLDGKPCFHVITTETKGTEWHWWFDVDTWHLVKTAHKRRRDDKETLVESRYSDYRSVAGMLQTFRSEHFEDGKKMQTFTVLRVEINRGVKESIFADRPGTRIGPRIY